MRIFILFFLIFFPILAFSNNNCTKDAEFCFYKTSLNRDEANKFCRDKGYKLASIKNKDEENKILSLVEKGYRYWIDGRHLKNTDSSWKWQEGVKFTYTNWGAGEPNNLKNGESYLILDFTEEKAFWNDNRNDGHTQKKDGIYVICQKIQIKSRNFKKAEITDNNNNFIFNILLYFIMLFPLFWFFIGKFKDEKLLNRSFHEIKKDDIGLARLAERNIHINKEILIILSWDNKNDLDLYVVCPNGDEISYKTLGRYICGGMLDVDANATDLRNDPIEKIGWDQYPTLNGTYKIFVNYYAHYDSYEIETEFQVDTIIFGKRRKFKDIISPKNKTIQISEFIINNE